MASELWLVRRMGHLVPANAQSAEALDGLKEGEWYLASVRKPRNVKHTRKYFALLDAIFPHQKMWPTRASFKLQMKKALGLGEWVTSADGRKEFIEGSISFASMKQDEFEEFYDRALDVIQMRVLPGIDRADVEREINDILKGRTET